MKLKIALIALAFTCATLWSPTSMAFVTSNTGKGKEVVQQLGAAFSGIAANFGCPEFVGGNVDAKSGIAELIFVPANMSGKSKMKRALHVQLFNLRGDAHNDIGMLKYIISTLKKSTSADHKILKAEEDTNEVGEPILFLDYEAGKGKMKFTSHGIFRRNSPRTAGYIEIMTWTDGSLPTDAKNIRDFAFMGTKEDGAKVASKKPE